MKCHCKKSCIDSKEEVLDKIKELYLPCEECTTKRLKKSLPLSRQVKTEKITADYGLCSKCKKRNIDHVMAHILKILMDNNLQSSTASIRKTGTPLITPGMYLERQPYLSENTLVMLIDNIDKKTARIIFEEVPEVKGVLKGNIHDTVGQITEKDKVYNYELLAGCDIRCDVQDSDMGEVLVYKQQSKIHVEYPKPESPKILEVKQELEKYDAPTVVDAMCGPGTLGIYALKRNAKKVIFNDVNENAIDNLKVNLEINGIDATGYEIYNETLEELANSLDAKYDLGLIDAFFDIDTTEYEKQLKKICERVVII
ncbi:MAG: RsmD family RNA methyltransferase [Methanosphaera sp.]|nr:RsmD family RNA methyltransferase [Methanosphaera sp.]